MSSSWSRRQGSARLCGALLALVLGTFGALSAARAGCFDVKDAQFARLRPLVSQDAKKALIVVNSLLADFPPTPRAPSRGASRPFTPSSQTPTENWASIFPHAPRR